MATYQPLSSFVSSLSANPSLLTPKSSNTQTTTPAYQSRVSTPQSISVAGTNVQLPNKITTGGYNGALPATTSPSLGVKAKSPNDNLTPATPTLPSSQVSSSQPNTQTNTQSYDPLLGKSSAPALPPTPAPTTTPPPQTPPTTQTGTGGANGGQSNPTGSSDLSNTGLYGKMIQNYIDKSNQSTQFDQALSQAENDRSKQAIPLPFVQGQQAALARDYGVQGTALASQAATAEKAAGLAAPVAGAAFFGSPVTGGQVGGNTSGGWQTGNSVIDTAVQNAVKMVQNGADPTSSAVTGPLSSLGVTAQNAFNTAMQQVKGGTYNPTATSAAANQNASQGASYQGQATQLSTTLNQLKNVSAPVVSLLNNAGLNQQENPFFNQSINTYASQLTNPAAIASLKAGMGEIKTYVAQVLGSSGDLTPTAVTAITNSFDPSNFTPTQLSQFLGIMDNYGQNRLQALQQTSNSSYGSPTSAFSGAPATPSSTTAAPTPNSPSAFTQQGPVVQGLAGGAMGSLEGVLGMIQGVASMVFK